MKKNTLTLALLAALSAMGSAQASQFEGAFVGARAGLNRADITGVATSNGKDATTFGVDAGYNWDIQRYLVGVDVFADSNGKVDHGTTTAPFTPNFGSDVYSLDMKLGLPRNRWMPYARLGYAHAKGTGGAAAISGDELHGGVGLEYKYTPHWGVNAEWSASSAKTNGAKLSNDNFTIGIRYYLGAPKVVAAAAPVAAMVAAKAAPAPVPAPVPVVAPAPVAVIAPAPVPVVAPVPVAVPAPAPQPKASWKTIVTEKPVRLEGASFASSSAKLLKTADVKLNEVVNAAKQHPEVKLEVSGHTDSSGKKAFNQKLSENRAAAVKAYLVQHGVAAERINTAGYADTQPIADNQTPAGRDANRRVEVRYVMKEEKKVRVAE